MKQNWTIVRIFRLLIGIAITVQGLWFSDWLFAIIGTIFSLMPVLNIGCCGNSGCNIPTSKERGSSTNNA
jgi:hypothetical protein